MKPPPSKIKKGDEVLNHNLVISPGIDLKPLDFYTMIEREIASHKIPGLTISKIEHAEGGTLSAKRIYLRMIRERLAFDTCAAPFGTEYFFSSWTVYSPPRIKLWQILAAISFLGFVYWLLLDPLGSLFDTVALVALIVAIAQMFRNVIAFNLADLDAFLLKVPVIGPIYETWFRKDTYFRYDTRMVYLEIIPRIIQQLIEEITTAKGVKYVREYERAPIFGGLYRLKTERIFPPN